MVTYPSNNARLSKSLGVLLGVHTGDSLGATLEFMTFNKIKSHYPNGLREIVGGGTFCWPVGHATDDTDLTRAVLLAYRDRESSTTAEKDVVKSAAEWSLKWLEGDWPGREKGETPVDIGNATYLGLSSYAGSRDPRKCGAGHGNAGNGSLMRCTPTALFTESREERIKESMEISAITHNDLRCTVSCAAYNEIIAALIQGKTPQEAVEIGLQVARDLNCPRVEDAIEFGKGMSIAKIAEEGPGGGLPNQPSGYVLHSLCLAIAALLDTRSFEDVLVDVVRIGGDTDTNGAIAGGLLGAREGIEAIPERWLTKLQFKGDFEEIVRGLLQSHECSTATKA